MAQTYGNINPNQIHGISSIAPSSSYNPAVDMATARLVRSKSSLRDAKGNAISRIQGSAPTDQDYAHYYSDRNYMAKNARGHHLWNAINDGKVALPENLKNRKSQIAKLLVKSNNQNIGLEDLEDFL